MLKMAAMSLSIVIGVFSIVNNLTIQDLKIISAIAASENSDPFIASRIMSHHVNGVKTVADYASEYSMIVGRTEK